MIEADINHFLALKNTTLFMTKLDILYVQKVASHIIFLTIS